MIVKICVIVILFASVECTFQNSRYKNGLRLSNGAAASRSRARSKTCSTPRLINGFVTPLFKGRMIRFDCNANYSREGERFAECLSGRWSIYTFPVCIKAGCAIVPDTDNGKIIYLNSKAKVMLFCEPKYEILGNSFANCNGSHWDRSIGSCLSTENSASTTSCDFESETICGWAHDSEHDFDFERRTGYNNRTILMNTGPQADHTTGIPFQGHYMVINTNSETFTKRSRLISPFFKLSAQTLCFKFYYHMYGVNIGTLRVYVKPESVDMQTILLEDTETEARNDYVVFEIKGSQGNYWREGGGFMKPLNESFQIIIEATSGQTRVSDIAFDDVYILSDGECLEADEEEKVQEMKNSTDIAPAFSVESCLNRCFEDNKGSVQVNSNNSIDCSCSQECDLKLSCCPDFIDVCFNELSVSNASTLTEKYLLPEDSTERQSFTTKNLSTIKQSTSSTTREVKPTISRTVSTTLQITQVETITNVLTTMRSEFQKDYGDVVISVEGEDEHDMDKDEMIPATTTYDSDNVINERFMMQTKSHDVVVSLIIKASLIAISAIFCSFLVFLVIYKQYKKTTNPLNYKEKQESALQKVDEEFSEIRFLTSDETLDFNLVSPENATDL